MQSNAIFGGALGDAYFTVYRRRDRRKIGPHGKKNWSTGYLSVFLSRESLALIGETGSGKTLIAQSVMGCCPEM